MKDKCLYFRVKTSLNCVVFLHFTLDNLFHSILSSFRFTFFSPSLSSQDFTNLPLTPFFPLPLIFSLQSISVTPSFFLSPHIFLYSITAGSQISFFLSDYCLPLLPFLALLISVSPVQSTLAVQQVHVATGMLLLTANNSAVQPLAPPLYVTQEILHRHILGGARAHGIENQSGAEEGILKLSPVPVTCKKEENAGTWLKGYFTGKIGFQ